MKKLLLVFLAVCLIVGLAACNDKTEAYKLTFDTLGGGENTVIVLDGSTELLFPDDPKKEGYDFKGWFFDKDVWEKPVSRTIILQTGIAGDTSVYAKWAEKPPVIVEEEKYEVSFNSNGGSNVEKLTDVLRIEEAPASAKKGYTFTDWYADADCTQKVTFPYTLQDDITLHAKWQLITYTITYNLDGGTSGNPATYSIESSEIALTDPVREGHTFLGWYSDSNFQNEIDGITAGTTGNMHVFAEWQINTYNIKYYLGGEVYYSDSEPVELSLQYGERITSAIKDTVPTPASEGNNFSGWKLVNGSEIPATMPAYDLEVYGTFLPKTYTVFYYVDDVYHSYQNVVFGTVIAYKTAPQKPNSRFSGWQYNNATLPERMPASNIDIKGYFTDTFDVIYKIDGTEYQRVTYSFGENVAKLDVPQQVGYDFSGWQGEPATMPATDIDVAGSFIPKSYKLTFVTPEGQGATLTGIPQIDGADVNYIVVSYNENFIYRLNEVKGVRFAYDFAGWTLDGAAFAPVKWDFTSDKEVIPAWREKSTQGLKYTLLSDGSYSVTGYSGLSGDVFISSTYSGKPVKTISGSAFKDNSVITSITVHNGVSRLGSNSFQNCINLTTVNLPASIQNIEAETFFGCRSLTGFNISEGVGVIGNAPFRGCSSLAAITVDANNNAYKAVDGVLYTKNGRSLIQFPEGKSAATFSVPSSVETLGNYAFNNCASLTSIFFGNISSIGCYAFAGTSITSMTIPDSVTWIGSNAFDRCTELASLSLPFVGSSKAEAGTSEGVFGYIFGNSYFEGSMAAYQWYDAVNYAKYYLPISLVSVVLTNTVTVPYGAFSDCASITDIELTKSVFIGEKSFFGCSSLQNVILPLSLTGIDIDAFNSCVSLSSLTLPISLTFIGEFAFHNCPNLLYGYDTNVNLLENYTYVFVGDDVYLDSYTGTLNNEMSVQSDFGTAQVVSIGRAFAGKKGMYTLSLPSGVTAIDRNAFADCGYLVVYAKSVSKPGDWVDKWDDVAIYWNVGYDDIKRESNGLCYYIKNGQAVVTKYIGEDDTVVIPDIIDDGTNPIPVTAIGKYAFAGNAFIESVVIPSSVSVIESGAFADCQNLTLIDVHSANRYFYSDGEALYNYSRTQLISYPAGRANLMDGVARLYPDFVLLPTVETISSQAFAYVNIETIEFGNALQTIEAGAFVGCSKLTDVIYLNITQISAIADKTFFGCSLLSSLTLPTTLKTIGKSAFEGCANLVTLNGAAGLKLQSFSGLESIGDRAFADCGLLPELTLPGSLLYIGHSAFKNCDSLTSMIMPDSVIAVGNAAFSGCALLESASLSSKLGQIAVLMFENCIELESITVPFVGSSKFAEGTEDSVLGYLFGYSKASGVGTWQKYGEGAGDGAYYYLPAILANISVTNAPQIPFGAFSNISSLTTVEISDVTDQIGAEAFAGCLAITNMILPFVGKHRDASGSEAILGYLFAETNSGDTDAIMQAYGDTEQGYYLISKALASIEITDASGIGTGALYNISSLTEAIFNANIISIGDNVLFGCTNIATLEIPFVGSSRNAEGTYDSVLGYLFGHTATPIAGVVQQYYNDTESTYYYIPATLTEVRITGANRIPYGAFMNTAATTVFINEGTTQIGGRAFAGNVSITQIVLPNTLINIGERAFDGCSKLDNVSLNKVNTVGAYAFRGTAIEALIIPDSVSQIAEGAFSAMTLLKTVSISVYNSNLLSIDKYAFAGDIALQTIALPNRLNNIGESVFGGCIALIRVSLPYLGATKTSSGTADAMLGYVFDTVAAAGLTAITQYAQDGEITYYIPSHLADVILTGAVQIGYGSLSGITNLNIVLNEGIQEITEKAFYNAEITSLNLPASVLSINESAFEGSKLAQMTFSLGSKLNNIDQKAFYKAPLTSFAVPVGVTSIGDSAFRNTLSDLLSLTFGVGSQLASIGDYAFEGNNKLTQITLPASLISVGTGAFRNCTALTALSVQMGGTLAKVGDYAFANTSINTVNLPASTKEIGEYAFAYTSLTALSFGGTESALDIIGSYAFAFSSLQSLTIPSVVAYIGINPFYETPIDTLNLSGYRSGYKVDNGVLYTKDGSVLVAYPGSLTAAAYTVPDGVVRVDAFAFAGNTHLVSLSLPASLLSIGYSAFEGCTGLDTVAFRGTANLLVIEEDAFAACSSLRVFPMPSTLTRIEDDAFRGTSSLTAADLSACGSLAYIGDSAFLQTGAVIAKLPDGLAVLGEGAFKEAANLVSISFGTSPINIEKEAFFGCVSLLGVSLPSNIQIVGESAFEACDSLASVIFPADTVISSIGGRAFAGTAITDLVLPQSLQYIGEAAFNNCSALVSVSTPFAGTDPAQGSLSTVFGDSAANIQSLTIANETADISVTSMTFFGMDSLGSLTLGAGVVSIAAGSLLGLPIATLDLRFVGTSANASGADAVLGSIFGFGTDSDPTAIAQNYGDGETAYVFIPNTLTAVYVASAAGFGAFSNITTLKNLTIRNGASLGQNLIAGCTGLESLSVPYAGASADATGDQSGLGFITGGAILPRLATLKLTAASTLTSQTFATGANLKNIEIAGNVGFVPEGLLAACTALETLVIPFIGATAETTGKNALFGYLYGFKEAATASTVTQYYSDAPADFAYSEIPASISSVTLTADSYLGFGAFGNMSELKYITILGNVKIGAYAFKDCGRLQSVAVGGNAKILEVGDYAFYGAAFETIVISAEVESIGDYAFANCGNLTNVSFEAGSALKSVGDNAFENCAVLQSITLPYGTLTVGESVFESCAVMTSAVIPATVTSIGAMIFEGCPNLSNLSLPYIGSDKIGAASDADKLGYFFGAAISNTEVPLALTTLTITSATYLAPGALQDTHITSLSLNEGILQIDNFAVANVPITAITLPRSVAVIGTRAFAYSGIQTFSVAPDSMLYMIGDRAFQGCLSLTDAVLPDSITSIGQSVFAECLLNTRLSVPFIGESRNATGASAVLGYFFGTAATGTTQKYAVGQTAVYAIPATLQNVYVTSATSIGYGAFSGCASLSSISIGGATTIGALSFEGTTSLTSLTLPFVGETAGALSTKAVMKHAFGDTAGSGLSGVTSLTITAAAQIYANAFAGMTGLKSVSLNNGIGSIAQGVFAGCLALETMTVPYIGSKSNPSIPNEMLLGYWFEWSLSPVTGATAQYFGNGASDVRYAKLPAGLQTVTVTNASRIGFGALSNLTALKTVSINKETAEIGKNVFKGCYNLETLTLPFIGYTQNATGDESKITYIFGGSPSNLKTITLTNATRLRTFAFAGNTRISTVNLNEGIAIIDSLAFSGLTSLTSITIPASVRTLGTNAFDGCTSLVNITFAPGNALTAIGESAFKNTAITSFRIPDSVTSLGLGIFEGCDALETLTLPYIGASITATGQNALLGYLFGFTQSSSITTTQIYDANSSAAYTVLPNNLYRLTLTSATSIGFGALYNCSDITEFTVNSGITVIERYAFANCSGLTDIVIPDSVISIGNAAFAGCSSLETVSLPFAGISREEVGVTALFGYVFGTAETGMPGATVQYYNATASRTFYIPETLDTITITSAYSLGYGVFGNLENVYSIVINEGITAIPGKAFFNCASIGELVIPASVVSIDGGALQGMDALASLTLPFVGASTDAVGVQSQFGYIFGTSMEYNENVVKQTIKTGETTTETLFNIPFTLRNVTLTGVSVIKDYAFNNCAGIATLTVTQGIVSIGGFAFEGALALSAIYADVTGLISIGESAFENCRSFLGIDLSTAENLESVGDRAFRNCTSLNYVHLPDGLSNLGDDVFEGSGIN